jgi:hypothetical protein
MTLVAPTRLHLIKLCVGITDLDDLHLRIQSRVARGGEHIHVTRQTPKRRDELLAGGSIYWVIKGSTAARQPILELRDMIGDDGITRCGIVLEPKLVPVVPRPKGAFQGWRYLVDKEAPPDLTDRAGDLPEELARELAELGLL